ncbi:MAG: hypothetical protein IPK24_22800 [Kineosporiaceae bacterium]|nr:hypothetical protein [Kineosporiaceae bacterium]
MPVVVHRFTGFCRGEEVVECGGGQDAWDGAQTCAGVEDPSQVGDAGVVTEAGRQQGDQRRDLTFGEACGVGALGDDVAGDGSFETDGHVGLLAGCVDGIRVESDRGQDKCGAGQVVAPLWWGVVADHDECSPEQVGAFCGCRGPRQRGQRCQGGAGEERGRVSVAQVGDVGAVVQRVLVVEVFGDVAVGQDDEDLGEAGSGPGHHDPGSVVEHA